MKICYLEPQGYCFGVKLALKIVNEIIDDQKTLRPIYILGMIIHNRFIIDSLNKKGVITLDEPGKTRLELLDLIDHGTVIFSAHGVADAVYQKALAKGLKIVDATCRDVKKVHQLIKENHDKMIIYLGKKYHPETEGVLGISQNIYLVSSIDDLKVLPDTTCEVLVTNQTTLSRYDLQEIHHLLAKKYSNITFAIEICQATTKRQEAVMRQETVDLCIVVGDKKSSNTKKLVEVAIRQGINTLQIESVDDLKAYPLQTIKSVSITSGASTPKEITLAVIDYLKTF